MKPVVRVLLTGVAIGVLIQTWVRARNPSRKEVSSGNKPIEGVATAVVALVAIGVLIQSGLRARNAYDQAIARGEKPIEAVGTSVAAFIGLTPGERVNK
jgi:hypothetical protein